MTEELPCWNCGRPAKYRGLRECARCYQRFKAHGDYEIHTRPKTFCMAEGCERQSKHFGWCGMHWGRLAKHDDPDGGKWTHRNEETCAVPGCGQRPRAMNLCGRHYSAETKRGHPVWKTPARRKIHGDRPWTPETVMDFDRVIDTWG